MPSFQLGLTECLLFIKQRIRKVWIAHHDHPVFGVKEAHARVSHLSKVGRNVPLNGLDCDCGVTHPCVSMTPFGRPVVPELYGSWKRAYTMKDKLWKCIYLSNCVFSWWRWWSRWARVGQKRVEIGLLSWIRVIFGRRTNVSHHLQIWKLEYNFPRELQRFFSWRRCRWQPTCYLPLQPGYKTKASGEDSPVWQSLDQWRNDWLGWEPVQHQQHHWKTKRRWDKSDASVTWRVSYTLGSLPVLLPPHRLVSLPRVQDMILSRERWRSTWSKNQLVTFALHLAASLLRRGNKLSEFSTPVCVASPRYPTHQGFLVWLPDRVVGQNVNISSALTFQNEPTKAYPKAL